MADLIDRQKIKATFEPWLKVKDYSEGELNMLKAVLYEITIMPSAQPERLTDDDFETIRIHLSAYKERLGNQSRWEEAEEYQRIIDRFMSFASAQPEIIRCKDCTYYESLENGYGICKDLSGLGRWWKPDDFCSYCERVTDD